MTDNWKELGPEEKRHLLARLLRERGARNISRCPLTHGQRALWFVSRFAPESTAHHVAFAVRVRSPLATESLARALARLAMRHAALRTRFREIEGVPVQEIVSSVELPVERIDVRGLDPESVRERVQAAHARPFDLDHAPLLRATVFSRAEGDHVLLLTLHHLIADYWSVVVLVKELLVLYAAEGGTDPVGLEEPPASFGEYARLTNAVLDGPEGERLWQYWRDVLADVPAPGRLAVEAREAAEEHGSATHRIDMEASVTKRLREFAAAIGVTPFIVLMAAFHVVVSRHTGAEDVVVGSLASGRTRARFRDTVGHFVNPMAIRVSVAGDPPVRELLARTREAVLGALRSQEFPYSLLVERLNPRRSAGESVLFRVLLVLQNLPVDETMASLVAGRSGKRVQEGGLTLEAFPVSQQEGEWEITVELTDVGGYMACEIKYRTGVLSAAGAARLGRHYVRLLTALVQEPERCTSELEMLDPDEREWQLVDLNRTAAALPSGRAVVDWLEDHARTRGRALALKDHRRSVSYEELRDRVAVAAARLVKLGVGPETLVAICAERGVAFVTMLLAVCRAGAGFLPLDPRYPTQRNRAVVDSSGASVVVVGRDIRHAAALGAATSAPCMVQLDEFLEDGGAPLPVRRRGGERSLAYVLFTSGSTGVPKGVAIENRGLMNHLLAKVEDLGLGPGDAIAQTASMAFDISVWQCLAAIVAGGRTVIVDDEAAVVPQRLVEQIERERITVLQLVPSVLRTVVDDAMGHARTRRVLGGLRVMVSTGEALSAALLRRWFEVCPGVPVVNAYGPTECADDVTHAFLTASPAEGTERVPIGRPIRNTRLYVLGPGGCMLPAGAPGELYVGGAGVGRGYVNGEAETGRVFVPDLFSGDPDSRLYRTGDRVRWLADGNLDLIGRFDEQIKLRGQRIEPGEIESILEGHPAVQAAAVASHEGTLVGYLVSRHAEASPDELRGFLHQRLPDAMIPSRFVHCRRLPMTSNGKLDRAALRAPDIPPAVRPVEPRSPLEEKITAIWADVLELERLSVLDNFFDLGGHSLAVTQIAFRIRESFGVDVPVVRLFEHPTVAELAAVVEEALQARAGRPKSGHEPVEPSMPATGHFIAVDDRPLAEQILAGELAPVEAATLACIPDVVLSISGLDRRSVLRELCRERPYVSSVLDTPLGRTAVIVVPRFASQSDGEAEGLVRDCSRASRLAREIGAGVVSLAGNLAATTDHGRALRGICGERLPVTTGHATTAAAVLLALDTVLRRAGRELGGERVAFIGLGAIGVGSLRLMLSRRPHPKALILCELYGRRGVLDELRREVREVLGFAGEVQHGLSEGAVAEEAYAATVLVGTTNIPDVLDVSRLAPGTILVDDSAPHCFSFDSAVERFERRQDIVATEGGVVHFPRPFESRYYYPPVMEQAVGVSRASLLGSLDAREVNACVLAGVLTARRPELGPALGIPAASECEASLDALAESGCSSSVIRARGNMLGELYEFSERQLADFQHRFGTVSSPRHAPRRIDQPDTALSTGPRP